MTTRDDEAVAVEEEMAPEFFCRLKHRRAQVQEFESETMRAKGKMKRMRRLKMKHRKMRQRFK